MLFDKEKAKGNLADILDQLHNNTDAALLQEYYKLYKKEISIFRRSWAAAWLFKYYNEKESPKVRRSAQKSGADKFISTIAEDESKRLFFSIGKNRRLFPREIISLIMTKTSAQREDIGSIRILDNFSFVQVRDTKADEIIEKLTGATFRGRTLSVNHAKPKTAEEGNED